MKITLKELLKQTSGAVVSLTVEQETEPFNNYTPTVELDSFEVADLTDNQIITNAWNKVKSNIITGMKRVNQCLELEWIDEEIACEGFLFEEPPIIPIVVHPVSNAMSFEEMMLWKSIELNNRVLELEKKAIVL